MHSDLRRPGRGVKDMAQCVRWQLLVLLAGPIVLAGCEEEPRHAGGKPAASSRPKETPGPIVGQRTQKVVEAAPALEKGNAKVASTKITAKDPITLQGNAYVSIIGRSSQLLIQQAIDLFRANNDRYPKDFAEFMAEIIKANNISLPKLPPYQEYAYDEKEHKLIILEYSDRK
jgi:hypothetical protein